MEKICTFIYVRKRDKVADVNKCHRRAQRKREQKIKRKRSNKFKFDTQLRREIKRKFRWGIWDCRS